MTERRWLALILVLFLMLGIYYAIATPVFEASDELWHYPMIRHLADGNELPVQATDPELAGPWKQEASQPPLYYYLGALLTFWIDTSDMDQIRWLNPHVDNGVITADGNINLVVHDPDNNPYQGTLLAVRIVRLFSVVLGLATVYLTYLIAKQTAPGRPEIALGAAAVNAFLPMFVFISGAVNNDNLVITLSSASLLLMILIGTRDSSGIRETAFFVALGVLLGFAALAKMSALGLIPLAIIAVFINRWRAAGRVVDGSSIKTILWTSLGRLVLIFGPALLIAGWWYYRNYDLYGDWSGWNAFIAVLGQRQTTASIAQLWDERWGFMISYWGLFGGLNVPMPDWLYWIFNALAIISFGGFLVYLFRMFRESIGIRFRSIRQITAVLNALLQIVEDQFALLFCILWSAAVVIGLIRWAAITWSSQGRLVFSAISALSSLFIIGLTGWLPQRLARAVAVTVGGFMLAVAILAPILWIQPAYEPPDDGSLIGSRPLDVTFDGLLRLVGYHVDTESAAPGDEIDLSLSWEALRTTDENWSVFVHLVDPALGGPVAQRDMYHGQGLRPSSLVMTGEEWTDRYTISLPETTITPADLELRVGLYNFETGQRLSLDSGEDSAKLTEISVENIDSDFPNAVNINFENAAELVGFEISPRTVAAGSDIQLALYWKSSKEMDLDYTFFAQVVDEDTTRWASQDLLQETSRWVPGEVQNVVLTLPVAAETPPKIYPLIIGVYSRSDDGTFDRLQVVTPNGRLTDDFYLLTVVRIE